MVISKDDVAIIRIYRLNLIILMRFVEASPCITYIEWQYIKKILDWKKNFILKLT